MVSRLANMSQCTFLQTTVEAIQLFILPCFVTTHTAGKSTAVSSKISGFLATNTFGNCPEVLIKISSDFAITNVETT